MRNKVTIEHIKSRIVKTEFIKMPDGKTTLAYVTMVNGFTVWGKSACVDPANFDQELGEKYSLEDAINQLWPLEGYLLQEQRFQHNLLIADEATENLPFYVALHYAELGHKIARDGWNGKGMWVTVSGPDTTKLHADKFWNGHNKAFALGQPEQSAIVERYWTMKTAADTIQMGWVPSAADTLAHDWRLVKD